MKVDDPAPHIAGTERIGQGGHMEKKQDSYCRERTKRRLGQIVPAFIILFIAAACGVNFAVSVRADKTGWQFTEYLKLVVSAAVAAGGLILGFRELAAGLRDGLFPGRSRLAKAIRSQLPAQNAGLNAEELFGIVDRDLYENGMWFAGDRVGVGREWVLGEDAVFIPRIRVACGRDEIVTRRSGGGSSRIVACYLVDDQKQTHSTELHDPDELKAFLDCLKLRAPDILFCSYREYLSYRAGSDIEWEEALRGFRHRKNEREFRVLEAERAENNRMQNKTAAALAGGNRFDAYDAAGLEDDGGFNPNRLQDSDSYTGSEDDDGFNPEGGDESWILPDLAARAAKQSVPPCLVLTAASGARQYHEEFEREDVEAAAEGLIDGSYRNVEIHTIPYCWMVIAEENGSGGHFHAGVTRPDADRLRFFSTEGTGRQAAMWLMDFYDGRLDTGSIQWRDDTKRMEKKVRKKRK
ncbi:MAG: hypothetical protein NC254_04065 [bacterium]|nr:hypothetical protein [bacterium]